jgi:trehalose 6-phosphate synthase
MPLSEDPAGMSTYSAHPKSRTHLRYWIVGSLPTALQYGAVALLVAALSAVVAAPYAVSLIEQWSRQDVERRSRLIFSSIQDSLGVLLAADASSAINDLFQRVTVDDRVFAIGFCDKSGALRFPSQLMPSAVACEKIARAESESFSSFVADGRRLVVAAFPISVREVDGHLIILNDLSFAEERGSQAGAYLGTFIAAAVLGTVTLATMIALIIVRRWISGLRRAISSGALSLSPDTDSVEIGLLGRELQDAIRQLDLSRGSTDGEHTKWSVSALRDLMKDELPGAEVIVVSNREPYIHNRTDHGIELQIPASGLVSALEPVMRACGGTWIAHGSGSADTDTVDAHDRLPVPPGEPNYTLRRVWISDEEQDGYYYGLANEGLWPLCHIAFVRPNFRETDWEAYRVVNERFAEAVAREARSENPIVLLQDYHFALLPSMVRKRLPNATIITFWHIPWPNAETFGICPWKEQIIEGLLGSSILGFHTQFPCNNFIETVDRFVESRIDREHASVTLKGIETFIRPYPISIEWPPAAMEAQRPVSECRANVRKTLGLDPDVKIGLGIERFDYTKGILDRMRAVDSFLGRCPEWKGRFVFLQVAAPTRSKLASYRALHDEAIRLADEINVRHGAAGYQPINLIVRHHDPKDVFELFRAADICIVSSLHDGMNLVAKEFVASRDDEQGVLILSSFAGASRELSEALIVNPYDSLAMGLEIERALAMPSGEQRERMRYMRELVESRNVYRWAGQMLIDASRLRKKQRILALAGKLRDGQ